MAHLTMDQAIAKLREQTPKYAPAAYHFVRRALDYCLRKLKREEEERPAHVSGRELLEGFRDLALEEFGPLAKTVLEDWGITKCSDVGEIVFQLVSLGVLGKSENDKIDDFGELWSFAEAFDVPFQPQAVETPKKSKLRTTSPARAKTSGNRSQQPTASTESD
ncbi:MAG: hypothetical protein EBZ53_03810 [Verrucomicrobia bacterium]|nr:hypothetical protein [Verrucomicrobiota bacterium]